MNATEQRKRVVVIGGGISGLAAAHRLVELDPAIDVTLVEASDRLGGVLHTVRRDGFLIEQSADNFVTDVPWAVDLCRRIGFDDQLLPTATRERGAMVVHRGKLEKVPAGFMLMAPEQLESVLSSPILSRWGKLRLLAEYLVPRRKDEADESLASFARRRLGREVYERLVQPLVGGIYTADGEKLSLRATLPRFAEMERIYGSLIRGARRQRQLAAKAGGPASQAGGARYSLFVAPRDGLSSLVAAIARRLPPACVRLSTAVESIARDAGGTWQVRVSSAAALPATISADAVIVAVSADRAARLLQVVDDQLSDELGRIPLATSVVVSLGYRRDQIEHPLDGFGFVVPAIERRRILAGSFASVKFPGRAPDGSVLARVFIGGACQSELAELPDEQLRSIATEELAALVGVSGEPIFADIARWPASMPQYHIGHRELVARIFDRASAWPGLALAGNAYHGVGIPSCIRSGEVAAEKVAAVLAAPDPASR